MIQWLLVIELILLCSMDFNKLESETITFFRLMKGEPPSMLTWDCKFGLKSNLVELQKHFKLCIN